jgi:putative transposase
VEVCKERNISEVTFHRWKKQFGQMDLNETKRLKELERENTELKKMLAEALLAKRVLEYVVEKIMSPEHKKQMIKRLNKSLPEHHFSDDIWPHIRRAHGMSHQ